MNSVKLILALVLMANLVFAAEDFFTQMYDYSRAFAVIGLTATASWSAYKHMMSTDPMAKKDAWETLSYAIVGAMIVLMAPTLSQVFS